MALPLTHFPGHCEGLAQRSAAPDCRLNSRGHRGQLAWDTRTRVNGLEKVWHMFAAFFEAIWNRPAQPQEPIIWSRHDFKPVAGW